jgi:hypothetical protein
VKKVNQNIEMLNPNMLTLDVTSYFSLPVKDFKEIGDAKEMLAIFLNWASFALDCT